MNHTPGPWIVSGDTIMRDDSHTSDQSDICYMNDEGGNDSSEWFADPDVVKADARLISASPDLLEALKELVAWMDNSRLVRFNGESLIKARYAIAKAEGTLDTHRERV